MKEETCWLLALIEALAKPLLSDWRNAVQRM